MAQKRVPSVDEDGRLFGKHMPTYLDAAAIQALVDRVKYGTAHPEGAVTGGVGTRYINTNPAGLNGRQEWVKTTSSGNTGWKLVTGSVEYDVSALFTANANVMSGGSTPFEAVHAAIGGTVKLVRNLERVTLMFNQYTFSWTGSAVDDYAYGRIPLTLGLDMTGFDPHRRFWFNLDCLAEGQGATAQKWTMQYRDIATIPDGGSVGDKSFNLMSVTTYRSDTGGSTDAEDTLDEQESLFIGNEGQQYQLSGEVTWLTTDAWPTEAPSVA